MTKPYSTIVIHVHAKDKVEETIHKSYMAQNHDQISQFKLQAVNGNLLLHRSSPTHGNNLS